MPVADGELSRLELLRQVELALGRDGTRAALTNALHLLLPGICQQALLTIDELDGSSSIVTAFVDPALERLALDVVRRYPPRPTRHPSEVAARTGEPLFRDVTEELMASIAHDAEHLALLRQFAATQLLVLPLRLQGRTFGVLALSTDQGRRFDAGQRTLAELVAARLAIHLDTAYFRRRVLLVDDDAARARWLEETQSRRSIERERLARIELELANARLRAITESGLLGTIEWGADGIIVAANDGFLKLVGRTREDVLARRLALAALLAGPVTAPDPQSPASLVVERTLVDRDGKQVTVLFGMTHIPELPDRGVAFVLDISEQRRRAELEALLVGIVSHDLRNPLGVISMAASLLLAQELTDAQRKLASRIESAGRKSARLIADLLDFTAARGAGVQLSPEPHDLHDVVAQAVDDLHATWPGRSIVHERVGEAISHMDQARVEQIASNLIGNALQHSPEATPVRIETRGDADAVSFSVQNEGKPIPGELIEQLFAPLSRGQNAGHRRGSVGLGLFIVHRLVAAHGGSIDVTSNDADGTRFTVRLPRSWAVDRARPALALSV